MGFAALPTTERRGRGEERGLREGKRGAPRDDGEDDVAYPEIL